MMYKIGFFVQNPFHYFLYQSVIEELINRGAVCHLLINDTVENNNEWKKMYEGLIEFLESIDRNDIEAFPISLIKVSDFNYDCVISPYYTPILEGTGKLHIRLMYGLAKEEWNFSWWNIYYDAILCYGDYDYQNLNIFNNCFKIGNPKFDNWFLNKLPNKKVITARFDIDKNKETILYAPTYGELSSIDVWIKEIKRLEEIYNVIIKLHHGTSYLTSELKRRQYITSNFRNVVTDNVDLLEILKISDILISDNSGVIFDGILSEKKVLLLNTEINLLMEGDSSPEQRIRKDIININHDSKHDLMKILKDKKIFHIQNEKLETLISKLYKYNDGFAGNRAANIILSKINNNTSENHLLKSLREKVFYNRN